MKKSGWVTSTALIVSLLLVSVAQTANAGAGPKVTTSIRVSRDCAVTVSGRWSDMPATTDSVEVHLLDYPSAASASQATTAVRGSYKTVWQATSSPSALQTLGAIVEVHAGATTYGTDQLDTTPLVPCSAPFTLISQEVK